MVAPKTYREVGRCIYCGSEQDAPQRLGDEHIIARGLGGGLLLPRASCQSCEAVTSGLEVMLLDGMLQASKPHFGLRARHSKRVSTHLPMAPRARSKAEKKLVHHSEHPSLLWMFTFGQPGLLCGRDPAQPHGAKFELIQLAPNHLDRLRSQGGEVSFANVGAAPFGRILAKIAHAYAVAEVGLSGFTPLLVDLILGVEELPIAHFVGERLPMQPRSDQLHEIKLLREPAPDLGELWIVRLRLFAVRDTPTFDIVTGRIPRPNLDLP